MTFTLSKSVDWKDIKNKVEGVKLLDHRRAAMVFRGPANTSNAMQASTTLLGVHQHPGVRVCSLYDPSGCRSHGENDHGDREAAIIKSLVEAPGTKKNRVISSAYDLVVFRISVCTNVDRLYEILLTRDASAVVVDGQESVGGQAFCSFVMDLELEDSLYITHDRVVWSIARDRILVSVEGKNPSEARNLVDRSRSMIALF